MRGRVIVGICCLCKTEVDLLFFKNNQLRVIQALAPGFTA